MTTTQDTTQDNQEPNQRPQRHYTAATLEDALGLWRDGWKQTRRQDLPPEWRHDYELAATAVELVGLRECQTMQDLLRLYYQGDRQLEPVIRGATRDAADHERLLNWGLVEDAAFWLRYRTLVGRAAQQQTETGEGAE